MPTASIVLDLVVLAIFVGCAIYYANKGLLSGLLDFVGTLAALIVAVLLARAFSPTVFDSFFRANLENRAAESMAGMAVINLEILIKGTFRFLPDAAVDRILALFGANIDVTAPDAAGQVVQNVIAPLIIPLIAIIIFFGAFAIIRVVLGVFSAMLRSANKLPLLGGANRALGAVMGVAMAVLYAFLVVCVLWAVDAMFGVNTFGPTYFGNSLVWRVTQGLNFFAPLQQ